MKLGWRHVQVFSHILCRHTVIDIEKYSLYFTITHAAFNAQPIQFNFGQGPEGFYKLSYINISFHLIFLGDKGKVPLLIKSRFSKVNDEIMTQTRYEIASIRVGIVL